MDHTDYDVVAELYDLYVTERYDYEFFLNRVGRGARVLELMAGTGRLSIPLVEAGAVLTAVDISQAMLKVLRRKLRQRSLQAEVLCADVQHLESTEDFDIAILPFQSFMELVGRAKQLNTLRSVQRCLVPDGRFYCTMHNPAVRRQYVDGVVRGVGAFSSSGGTVVVSGFETGGEPVVRRTQFVEQFDETGRLKDRILQAMEFELIDEAAFRRMAIEAGFEVAAVFGDYHANEFDSRTSPVMIWELSRRGPGSSNIVPR